MPHSPINDIHSRNNDNDITSREAGNEVKRMVEAFERKLSRGH